MKPTDRLIDDLKALKVDASLDLKNASYDHKQLLYRAAYRLGITISIRRTPDGTKLWRLA